MQQRSSLVVPAALVPAGRRQREAVGLTRHQDLYETLRVPAEVRAAMGPRRRR